METLIVDSPHRIQYYKIIPAPKFTICNIFQIHPLLTISHFKGIYEEIV